jgi:hypothetical protein
MKGGMQMNKKFLLIGMLALLGIGAVSALVYYALLTTTITVLPAIVLGGDLNQDLGNTYSEEPVIGSPIEISNNAPSKRDVTISDDGESQGVSVEYVSEVTLSQKVVVFGETNWALTGDTAVVRYTVVGDSFNAEVVSGNKDGYVLVYYKDNSDRFNSPAKAIRVEDVVGNLAYEDDNNNEEDYCLSDGYTTCHGAKLWYIPETAVDSEGNIDWSQASDFLFETNLIQYNSDGEITIYPESTLTVVPVYTVGQYESGEKEITTTVA